MTVHIYHTRYSTVNNWNRRESIVKHFTLPKKLWWWLKFWWWLWWRLQVFISFLQCFVAVFSPSAIVSASKIQKFFFSKQTTVFFPLSPSNRCNFSRPITKMVPPNHILSEIAEGWHYYFEQILQHLFLDVSSKDWSNQSDEEKIRKINTGKKKSKKQQKKTKRNWW